jgi:tetratricopeptide (TPR) repeat protein
MTKSQLAINELAKVAAVFETEDEDDKNTTPIPEIETDLEGKTTDLFDAVDLEKNAPEIKLEEDINDWRAILKYADTAMQLGRYDRAEQGYQQALEAMAIEDVLPFEIDYAMRKKLQARVRGLCEPWYAERDKLSGTEKAQAVLSKMNDVNPDRPDAETSPWRYQVQRGKLVTMTLENGAYTQFLEPLKGLLLREITFNNCPKIADLTALKGMAIGSLTLNDCTALEDLKPLKGMPLTELVLRNCPQLDDLSPLEGIPLTSLVIEGCGNIADISLLKDMPLERLEIDSLGAKNLGVLHGMPLKQLKLGRLAPDEPAVQIEDLNFLAAMPLKRLALRCDGATDLSPISGMPLTELAITSDTLADISPIATLEPLESLALSCGRLESIKPLGKLLLTRLDLSYCDSLSDISPLKGMLLEWLSLDLTGVNDLSALKDMPLTNFFCGHWKSITNPSGLEHIRNPGLRDNVALLYINQGKWKDAERVYLSMLDAWPESDLPARGLRFIAQSYLASGKHDEAQRLCQARIDALSSPAAKAPYLMIKARIAIEKGEHDTASELFLRITDSWKEGPFFPELILSAYILGETLPMADAANQPDAILRSLLPPDVSEAIEEPVASTIGLGPTDVSLAFRTYSGWANQHLVRTTMSLPKNAVHFFIACRHLLTGDKRAAAVELQKCVKLKDGNGYGMQAARMRNDK